MVFVTKILSYAKVPKIPRRHTQGLFIDSLRLLVKAGTGGNGLPKYGGIGGQGGDVYVVASESESLSTILKKYPSKRIHASHGSNSHQNYILGPPGEPVKIDVPVGITVLRDDGRIVGELNEPGAELLVAKGGAGGSSKNGFFGAKGQSHTVVLDLKLIADVGLVGFPNAGKSTLLRAVSQARPKVASYPFTTIRPSVGVVQYPDLRQVTVADLPGLIEGAHANVGMGHRFLKHVERTKLLLLVVDVQGFQLSPRHKPRSCLDTVVLLNRELELYRSELLAKPALLVVNKMDLAGAGRLFESVRHQLVHLADVLADYPEELRPRRPLVFDDVLALSAEAGGRAVAALKDRVRASLDIHAAEEAKPQLQPADGQREHGPRLV